MSVRRVSQRSAFLSRNIHSTSGYEDRLIGHWIGRENGMMMRDRSQYARHGILTNGPYFSVPRLGSDEPGLLCDYTDDCAVVSRQYGPIAFPASMACWYYWDGTQSGNDKLPILHTDSRNGPGSEIGGYGLRLWGAVGNNVALYCPNGGQSLYYSSMTATSGKWQFLAFSCTNTTGDNVNICLDGQTTTAQTTWTANNYYLPNGPTDFVNDITIGSKFPGMIGECLWWNRALSTSEMVELADPTFSPANIRPARRYFVPVVATADTEWIFRSPFAQKRREVNIAI